MTGKRTLVLDAALRLLGERGPRALTHRAVDEAAGLPAGSASNYFRTRAALLIGITALLEERDHAAWERAPAPRDTAELVEVLCAVLRHAVTADEPATLARYALMLEARELPEVREALRAGHLRLTAWLTGHLRAATDDPAIPESAVRPLIDYLDGFALHHALIGGFDTATVRTTLHTLVTAAISRTG
ncbi:TetR/AcrR family transcriptional regulator [Nocardia asteroides]|uniref:TetR/AcrR family transcriptional regulator n=1 Tax=Nocardia asteroides TaxID=1824 RepID=UPI001E2A4084|nr:TetR/AcrR family transcriptional regulator [Nocardia asteroides]UGT60854.1 TetR family transcriptional regulator [Nocardia asteroides]